MGFKDEDVNDIGDLLLDITEALQDNDCHSIAKPLLERLVHSEKYSKVGGDNYSLSNI